MAYHVKVIPPSGRARIHKDSCKFCREGQGMANQDKGTGPTYWEPAHPNKGMVTIKEAENFMANLGLRYKDKGKCPYCMKS
jgi:hypothetical protein